MKRLLTLAIAIIALTSCNSEPSLQKYFVESQEKKDFLSLDIGSSILQVKEESLTPDQRAALKTFERVNVLAFTRNDSNASEYKAESEKVKQMLKTDKYQELMHFGSGKDGGSISYVGADDDIEEFVIFANRKDNGFAVIRVLGDGMSPNAIMQMLPVLQSSKLDIEQLKPLQQIMQPKAIQD